MGEKISHVRQLGRQPKCFTRLQFSLLRNISFAKPMREFSRFAHHARHVWTTKHFQLPIRIVVMVFPRLRSHNRNSVSDFLRSPLRQEWLTVTLWTKCIANIWGVISSSSITSQFSKDYPTCLRARTQKRSLGGEKALNLPRKGLNKKRAKQSTAGIRWWSPTQLLTCRHMA